MIFVQRVPWRLMAVPTPPLLLITLLPPLPFVYALEYMRGLRQGLKARSSVRLMQRLQREKQIRYLFVYSSRRSSQSVLENEVIAQLPVQAVLWDNGNINKNEFRQIESILPRDLGNRFPLLVCLDEDTLQLHTVHDCVYMGLNKLRPSEEIYSAITQRIADIDGKTKAREG